VSNFEHVLPPYPESLLVCIFLIFTQQVLVVSEEGVNIPHGLCEA